jgi:hypothetical protein
MDEKSIGALFVVVVFAFLLISCVRSLLRGSFQLGHEHDSAPRNLTREKNPVLFYAALTGGIIFSVLPIIIIGLDCLFSK